MCWYLEQRSKVLQTQSNEKYIVERFQREFSVKEKNYARIKQVWVPVMALQFMSYVLYEDISSLQWE